MKQAMSSQKNNLPALPQSQALHGLMRLSSRGQRMLQGCS